MKNLICNLLLFSMFFSFAQTSVGDTRFNDVDVFDDVELILNGAGAVEKLYAMVMELL